MRKEKDFEKLVRKNFESRGALVTKIHGSIYSKGLPDFDILWKDYHLKLELKFKIQTGANTTVPLLTNGLTELQRYYLSTAAKVNPKPKHIIIGLFSAVYRIDLREIVLMFVDPRSKWFERGSKIELEPVDRAEKFSVVDGLNVLQYKVIRKKWLILLEEWMACLNLPDEKTALREWLKLRSDT